MSKAFFSYLIAATLCAPVTAAGQSPTTKPATTLRANVNLVVVDVVVTDARKRPVHNLTTGDFTLLEDGQAQTIKTFEENAAAKATTRPALPKLAPGTFTNYSPTPIDSALDVLLLDTLNTPMQDQSFVRDQMLQYLKGARPGVRMAIFGLSYRLRLLQGFTSDPELLRAVLNGNKAIPKGSPLLNNPMAGDGPGTDNLSMDAATELFGNSPNGAVVISNLQQFQAENDSVQLQFRARYTLDAFNQIGRYLSRLPGRKNLIWFSGSFPIGILSDGNLQSPFAVTASSQDEFRETMDLLARSQVAVYPINAHGVTTSPMLDAANFNTSYASNPGAFGKDTATYFQQTSDEVGTMKQMAEATGGEAFINTNGLKQAVERVVEAGSNYYTLAYTPTNNKWEGDYRKIQIKLARPGLTLSYRRGYYADDPYAPAHHGDPQNSSASQGPYNAMHAAMLWGSPDPAEIYFVANVRPSSAGDESTIAPGNTSSPKTTGPYRRYSVLFSIVPKDVDCAATPDEVRHCRLESMIFVYDADGVLLNSQSNRINADIPAPRFASLLQSGIRYREEISVPAKGESFLRIGVRDQTTDRIGTVELPISAVSKLPLFTASTP